MDPVNGIDLIDLPCESLGECPIKRAVGLAPGLPSSVILKQAVELGLWQIVQKTSPRLDSDLRTASLMLSHPKQFLDFPISSILTPSSVNLESEIAIRGFDFEFEAGNQKNVALESFALYWKPVLNQIAYDDAFLVADELLSNALFNAPFANPEAKSNSIPRTGSDLLDMRLRPGRLIAGRDKDYLIIGCEDSYGSLNPVALIRRLSQFFESDTPPKPLSGPGGAGLGTFMIYNSCASFYIGVKSDSKTVICASIPLRGGKRLRMEMKKGLHVFRT